MANERSEKEGSRGETMLWLIHNGPERAEREEMEMGLADTLWAKELLTSNNLGRKYSLCHLKGTKLHPEEN